MRARTTTAFGSRTRAVLHAGDSEFLYKIAFPLDEATKLY